MPFDFDDNQYRFTKDQYLANVSLSASRHQTNQIKYCLICQMAIAVSKKVNWSYQTFEAAICQLLAAVKKCGSKC